MLKTTIFWKLLPIYGRSREGQDNQLISFRQVFHPLTIRAPSLKERGIGSFGHFQFPHVLSQYESILTHSKEREGLDNGLTSFRQSFHPLSRRERDGTAQSHSVPSPPFGLRPEAVILDRAVFASLSRGQSNPLRGFSSTSFSLETKSEALRLRFSFQRRERDSNPRSCDRLRISRPAHSTTLASLRGLHNIV